MNYLIFIAGVIVGLTIMFFLTRPRIMGMLRLYESDEPGESPYLFVELNTPVYELRKHKHVYFKISQK
jgi:hypothetical protein